MYKRIMYNCFNKILFKRTFFKINPNDTKSVPIRTFNAS